MINNKTLNNCHCDWQDGASAGSDPAGESETGETPTDRTRTEQRPGHSEVINRSIDQLMEEEVSTANLTFTFNNKIFTQTLMLLVSSFSDAWLLGYCPASALTTHRWTPQVAERGETCLSPQLNPLAPHIGELAVPLTTWPLHPLAMTPHSSGWRGWRRRRRRRRISVPSLLGCRGWNALIPWQPQQRKNWIMGFVGAGGEPPWIMTPKYWLIRLWITWGSERRGGKRSRGERKREERGRGKEEYCVVL